MGRFKDRLESLNGDGRYGFALLAACAVLLLPEVAGEAARVALRYDRAALGAGEWWRLLTAHGIHLNLTHALLNTAGLALVWMLFARDYRPWQWAAVAVGAVAAIDAGLWLLDSGIEWYVGASGVLHGLMAAGTWALLRCRKPEGWVFGLFLAGKLVYEQFAGAMPFSTGLGPLVVNSHLYGALGGLAVALTLKPRAVPL